jgi:hypothetical protein
VRLVIHQNIGIRVSLWVRPPVIFRPQTQLFRPHQSIYFHPSTSHTAIEAIQNLAADQMTVEKKRRHAINERQRQLIRRHAQRNPLLRQTDLAVWASTELGHPVSQSTISESLSKRYDYLDTQSFSRGVCGVARIYQADHPILERALLEWVLLMEGSNLAINGDMIKAAASELWNKMPDFRGIQEPRWSTGWLTGFKRRNKIKQYKQSGEKASADLSGSAEDIERLKGLIKGFDSEDTYNADETGLFWLLTPEVTLATKPQSGSKKKKDRLTVFPTSNATGTQRTLVASVKPACCWLTFRLYGEIIKLRG